MHIPQPEARASRGYRLQHSHQSLTHILCSIQYQQHPSELPSVLTEFWPLPADLTGTVPATLANLKQLQHLDLEFNFLSGSMQFLCNTTDNSLETLYLRANNFSGPLNLTKCLQLQIADVQVRSKRAILCVGMVEGQLMSDAGLCTYQCSQQCRTSVLG